MHTAMAVYRRQLSVDAGANCARGDAEVAEPFDLLEQARSSGQGLRVDRARGYCGQVTLTTSSRFCLKASTHCATFVRSVALSDVVDWREKRAASNKSCN